MRDNFVSDVFDNEADAERAVFELGDAGVQGSSISLIAQRKGEKAVTIDGSGE